MDFISRSLWIRFLFCFITTLVTSEYSKKCGERYVNREGLCCDPIFNCGPGSEIKPCDHDYGPETCQKCQNGTVQPDHITSFDKEISCFVKHNECTAKDLAYSNKVDPNFQPQGCKCNIDACFIEKNNVCVRKETCEAGYELHPMDGVCLKCPENTSKLHDGCSPCIINKTLWLRKFSQPLPTTPVSGMPHTQFNLNISSQTQTYTSEIHTNRVTSESVPNENLKLEEVRSEKKTVSVTYLYIVVAVVVALFVPLILLSLFTIHTRRKNQRNAQKEVEKGALLTNTTQEKETNTGESLGAATTCLSENTSSNTYTERNNLNRPNISEHRVKPVLATNADVNSYTFSTNPGPSTRKVGKAMKIISSSGGSSDGSIGTLSLSSSGGDNEVVFSESGPQRNEERQHLTREKHV